ncbi:TVP38/TMEM64 family protein [Salipaludibacillus keqinensis]|uniref:TVP38/TMEM64 family membrane protein n=2 Tax=Salipaludibacillus keqinensis TaxID=2045207 RepID=A0A323TNQ6_9BACI|nr:TVP38/TMEM64 family protein [Salipaludibacillus keqinensis]
MKGAIVLFIVGFLLWINIQYVQLTPEDIREAILPFGWLAPLIYVLIYTIRPLVLFPASILSLAGGLLFGPILGTVAIVVGASSGAILSFWVARKLGKNIAAKKWTGKGEKIQSQLEENGFFYVLTLRLIPLFNFDMISYLSGISKVKFRHFMVGTVVGMIPGSFAYSFLGASFVEGDAFLILTAVSIFILVSTVPFLFRKRLNKKIEK